jgi:hypothetical protein
MVSPLRVHNSKRIWPQSNRAAEVDYEKPEVPMNDPIQAYHQSPAFAKHLNKLHILIPGRLAYAALTPVEIFEINEDARCSNVSVLSSYLHKQYMPFCADFGPVALNVVHRFCQVV